VGAEPLGVVAAHPGGRGGEALGAGLRGDQLSFANLGRVAVAGPAAGDVRVDGGQQGGARAVVVSGPGRGLAGAQGVVDAVGDRRTVAGAGEAVGEGPVLERVLDGPAAGLDVRQHLDRRRDPRAGRHCRDG
jgi:hypothetical protein